MDRLTIKPGICANASTDYCESQEDCYLCTHGKEIRFRLSSYEDTGLNPDEIKDMQEMFHSYRRICAGMTPDRLRELVEADRGGRLISLPCKVGDTAYRIMGRKNSPQYLYPATVAGIHIVREENCRYKTDEPHLILKVNGGFSAHVAISRIGKDVFLDREEAERALEDINGKTDV